MRLIDVDKLIEQYCEENCGPRKCTDAMDGCVFIDAVKDQPTAFDLNAVMKYLHEELKLADEEKARCARENALQFDCAKGYANGIANAIEHVKSGMINKKETVEIPWIPCRARLPEESGYYLACVYDEEADDYDIRKNWFAHRADYDIDKSEWRELYHDEKVVAWTALPEPYKEK